MTAAGYSAGADASIFTAADAAFGEVKDWLSSQARSLSESAVERDLAERGREVLRRLLAAHVALRCEQKPRGPVVGEDGEQRTHVRRGLRTLMTVFGIIEVLRDGYSGRGLDSRFPVDAELNLPPERASLEVQRLCGVEASRGSFDEGVDALQRMTGAAVAKRQFEQLAVRAAQDFDAFYDSTEDDGDANATGEVLVLTFDGKGIVMRFDGLRLGTQKAAKRSEHKLTTRLSKGEKANRKRMAEVAAVYTIAPWVRGPEVVAGRMRRVRDATEDAPRPRPERKRVWASLEKPPGQVVPRRSRRRTPATRTGRSAGWCSWMARAINSSSCARPPDASAPRSPSSSTSSTCSSTSGRPPTSSTRRARRRPRSGSTYVSRASSQGKASGVAAGIKQSATKRKLTLDQRKNADKCARYLLANAKYLRYHEYLRDGLPIATGVIEGACRHLIADRMDITGARWGLHGAEAILRLRSLRSSGDFDDYWVFHEEQERARNHEARYADGAPPMLVSPAKPPPPQARHLIHMAVVPEELHPHENGESRCRRERPWVDVAP